MQIPANIIPVKFYGYPSVVTDSVFELDVHISRDWDDIGDAKTTIYLNLQNDLINLFLNHDIQASEDNKIVFECEVEGKRVFYGFKDWKFSIGFGVSVYGETQNPA